MHSIKANVNIYSRVVENAKKIRKANDDIDLSAAYLINKTNDNLDEIKQFIKDFKGVGCNFLRFSFYNNLKILNCVKILCQISKNKKKLK